MITFEQFKQADLRVAHVQKAERVEGSDKLLRLEVDLGAEAGGMRQIIAGIGKSYAPEDLIDTEIIIVANLAPRMLMGLESQGMLLAAGDANGPVLLRPERHVQPGSAIN